MTGVAPELFSAAWFSALLSIVLIDLVLAGDNALVIGLAARDVPPALQRRVILWGTAGAIVVRATLTGAVVWLLRIPGFLLIGGLALVYIGWKLTRGSGDNAHAVAARHSGAGAVQTIIVADAVMGIDNVLAVGGAARGSLLLVLLGLAISIPIVIWGSTLVLRMVERFPTIMWLGAGVLGWTGAKMIASEPWLAPMLASAPSIRTLLYVAIVAGLVGAPLWRWLTPARRQQFAALVVVAIWLTAWGEVERRLGQTAHPFADWRFADELVDLIRWIGWIPLVLGAQRWLAQRIRAS